ncbi:family 78 glycoside hydrolase catalytic domain [Paenibacillus nasutitermitis]|uniref:Alpha-L-rhamnosidase n=1 Tax=Paenibacillus nasutitermitis TaxID=1652958 RepID=A0A916ZF11_9BACL|nr:family 78 glycoside hydrolase catalytic domain [Paenibacillus nasutitermitis]GGD93837.1 hypothetical protein GCM10010911_60630 [Paenibacillus nasutitermitis]
MSSSSMAAAAKQWSADWIWAAGDRTPVNAQMCFRKSFELEEDSGWTKAMLAVTADSRYQVYLNGTELGTGPVRSMPHAWYYDEYDVRHLLRAGKNNIAVRVAHFGHSNYQYIEHEAGLLVQLELLGGAVERVIASDESWSCSIHPGYKRQTVKRNVNLGWMEAYDASAAWQGDWTKPEFAEESWTQAVKIAAGGSGPWGELRPRDILPMQNTFVEPQRIVSKQAVRPEGMVLSLNLREALYPGRRDANANIFSAYLAVELIVQEEMEGVISFPHPSWNGVYGNFAIGGQAYSVHPDSRTVEVSLLPGRQLFLMRLFGIHDDLFVHLEFRFPGELAFGHPFPDKVAPDQAQQVSPFVVFGPFETIVPAADGIRPVYGGLEGDSGLDANLPEMLAIGVCTSAEALAQYAEKAIQVPAEYVYRDEHIYSLMRNKKVLQRYPVLRGDEVLLHATPDAAQLERPDTGDMEIIVDFGTIHAGFLEFELEAQAGTVIDWYGFESMPGGVIEFTEGLNNSVRYICREGRQSYRSINRMGFRYLMMTVRGQKQPISVYGIRMVKNAYPVSGAGQFRCSDDQLTEIWRISRHTHHLCMEDTFVDCPTFEQVYWLGDANTSMLINYQLFGSYELVRHCLELAADSAAQSKLIPALMPTDWQASIPFWTFNWIIAVQQYTEHTGDTSLAAKLYPSIKQTVAVYESFINEEGLFDISSWNLLDWAELDISNKGVVTAQQGLLAYCFQLACRLAEHADAAEDGLHYEAVRSRLLAAMNRHLWDEERKAFIDGISRETGRSTTFSMQTHVLLHTHNALSEETRPWVERQLLSPPEHWVKIGSPFMSFYLFQVYSELGQTQRILDTMRKEWGMMLRHGSTTCWETFPGFYKTRLTRSYAQGWSAAPAYAAAKYVLGLQLMEPAYRTIAVVPPQETDLTWAEGSVPTPAGLIEIAWTREAGSRRLTIQVPAGVKVNLEALDPAWDAEVTVRQG